MCQALMLLGSVLENLSKRGPEGRVTGSSTELHIHATFLGTARLADISFSAPSGQALFACCFAWREKGV